MRQPNGKGGSNVTKEEALKSLFIFEGGDFSALDKKYHIISSACEQTYGDGETVLRAGGSPGLPVIAEGRAQIVSGEGSRCAVLRSLSEGDSFGAASLFAKGEAHRTAVKSVGGCRVVTLPKGTLMTLIKEEPNCAVAYISFLSDRISFLNRKITAFTAGSAEAKLSAYLSGLERGADGAVSTEVSYIKLAQMLGISRASLYRSLDSLEAEGLIERRGRTLYIKEV